MADDKASLARRVVQFVFVRLLHMQIGAAALQLKWSGWIGGALAIGLALVREGMAERAEPLGLWGHWPSLLIGAVSLFCLFMGRQMRLAGESLSAVMARERDKKRDATPL